MKLKKEKEYWIAEYKQWIQTDLDFLKLGQAQRLVLNYSPYVHKHLIT